MGRRSFGVLTIILAAVAAVVVSAAVHQVTPGHAVVAAPERAPVVGDCLLTPASHVDLGGLPSSVQTLLAGCDGSRYGEVVHVGTVPETEWGNCANATRRYVGLSADMTVSWTALPPLQALVISPTWAQQADGQKWAACVAYVGDTEVSISFAHLLDQWISASPLSECLFAPGVTELRDAQCSAPHRTEVLGTVAVDAPLPDLNGSCRELAMAATRMADPTAGGGLQVQAVVTHDASPGASTAGLSPTGEGTATCQITAAGAHTLTGSLLGLGTHAVPWA